MRKPMSTGPGIPPRAGRTRDDGAPSRIGHDQYGSPDRTRISSLSYHARKAPVMVSNRSMNH